MVSVADRYRSKAGVSCEGRGLVQETHADTGFTTRIQVHGALHRPSIWPVPARTGEVVGQRSCSRRTSGSKHCRVGHGFAYWMGETTSNKKSHAVKIARAISTTTTARKLLKVDVIAQLAAAAVNAAAHQCLASIGISTRSDSYNTSEFVQQWPDHSLRLNNRTILKGTGGVHLLKDGSLVL
ncbi:hypothetical protein TIFTF001_036477 [Ficus carica]|uniref:Uncharacterized protein n=1 Tax=Ficus carica TaxID=3494 RepID=A0AA88E4G4_FICCA|nr:hypothetical protein TIFTF001_036477 [Ficus carica]